MLEGFRTLGFAEQFAALDQVEKGSDPADIDVLIDLICQPLGDDIIDSIVARALRTRFDKDAAALVRGLEHDHHDVQLAALQTASESNRDDVVAFIEKGPEGDLLYQSLLALAKMNTQGFNHLFRQYLGHGDQFVVSAAMDALANLKDETVLRQLSKVVDLGEQDDQYLTCDLLTGNAIEAIGTIGSDACLSYLASKVDHRNPTARRFIHFQLTQRAQEAIPYLANILKTGYVDQKILSANLLGFIGHESGLDALIACLNTNDALHPNVKYAVYEALGRIPTLRSVGYLAEGLKEEDELLLMATLTAVDNQVNPGIVMKIAKILMSGSEQSKMLVEAILASKSGKVFGMLYRKRPLGDRLVQALLGGANQDIVAFFKPIIAELGNDQAKADVARLEELGQTERKGRLLAIDDSGAMLKFYELVGQNMDFDVTVAGHGKEAMDQVAANPPFDLVITDMNMPVMDGIEFTTKFRVDFKEIPVVMATTESENSQRDIAFSVGVNDFLSKPFSKEQLQAKLSQYLAVKEP